MATKKPLAVYSGKIKELQSGDAVSYDQIGALATARLVGRSTAGTGALEAISIGSGLSLSAGTLSATGGGITIGNAVSGGGANRVLYEDGSQNLAASALMVFTGSELQIKDTANLIVNKNVLSDTQGILDLQVVGISKIKFNPYDAGGASRATFNADPFLFENVHATGQLIFNSKGSFIFRENGNSWFYLTNSQKCGINVSAPSAKLEVRVTSGPQFMASYDASNYCALTVSSTGGVTFDAVGSGAGFTFSDDVTLADAKNIILNTTTGTKIGTATSQKLSLWNATPIVQPSSTGQTAGFTAGAGTNVVDGSTFTGGVGSTAYTIGDIVRHLKNFGLIAQ